MQITGVKVTNNAIGDQLIEFRCELLNGREVVIGVSRVVPLAEVLSKQSAVTQQVIDDAFNYLSKLAVKIESTKDGIPPATEDFNPGVVHPVVPAEPKSSFITPVAEPNSAKQALEEIKRLQEIKKQEEEKPTANLGKVHKWTRQNQGAKYAGKCKLCGGTINKGDAQMMKPHPTKEGGWEVAHPECVNKI